MDPNTWLAIGVMGVAALLADICIAYFAAVRAGPARARKLIIADPLFEETRKVLFAVEKQLEDAKSMGDSGLSKHLERVESLIKGQASEAWQGELKTALADLRRQSDRLSAKLDNPPALSVSPEVEDRIVKSVRARVASVLEEQIGRIQVQMGGAGATPNPQTNPDAYMAYVVAQQNAETWSMALQERGYPPGMSRAIAQGGEMVVRAFAAHNGLDPREILG